MKSKKIFVLVSSLALLLAACNKPASTSQSQEGSTSAAPTTSETSNPTSQGGQTEVAVTALAINKATLSLEAGKSESLSVTVTPENASNTKVTWETSDAKVATVSSLGKVTAVKVGTATITAKSVSNPTVTATCVVTVTEEGGKYGSANKPKTVAEILAIAAQECKEANDKTAEPVYVKGIVHKAPTYNAEKGYSSGIYLKDALTDEKDLWVFSANHDATKIPYQNDEVVLHGYLMNYNGTIEITNITVGTDKIYPEIDAVTRGTSTITYSATHGAFNAEAPKSAKNNAEIQFSVTPDNGYKVDNVTVNGDALAPQADGSYKTYVKGNMAIVANISEVGVDMKTATMETKPETSTNMAEGNNAAAVGLDATIFNVESDNPTGNYAGLNAAGNIRLYNGYKNEADKTLGTKITVSSRRVTIKKIDITLASTTVAGLDKLEVKAGDTVVTGAEGSYEINNAQFSLKNVSNASVSDQIHIAKVVISYVENAEVAARAIAVSPETLTLKVEQTKALTATLTPANATSVITWETSNDKVATVDQTGKVTAVAEGNATITAKVSDDIKATCAVTVEKLTDPGTTQDNPLNVTGAIAACLALGPNTADTKGDVTYYVKGQVSEITSAWSSSYNNITFNMWLGGEYIQAFRAGVAEGLKGTDIAVGDEVLIAGKLENYRGKAELQAACTVLSRTAGTLVAATSIAVDKATVDLNLDEGGVTNADVTATIQPATATVPVTATSSNTAAATVKNSVSDAIFNITGVAAGEATVTFKAGDKTATTAVTVTKTPSATRAELPYTGNVANGSLPEGWTGNGATFANSYYALKADGAYAQAVALIAAQSKIKVDVKGICNGTSKDSTVTVYGLDDDGKAIQGASATYTPDKANTANAAAVDSAATVKSVTLEGTGITGVKVELTTKGHNYVLVSFAISVVA